MKDLSGNDKHGFTLMEMGLALSAFLLLLSITMIIVNQQQTYRRDVNRTANLSQLTKALELYVAEYNHYPSGRGCITGDDPVVKELIDKKFFEEGTVIADPRWPDDLEYCFLFKGDGPDYEIRYYLETDKNGNKGFNIMTP